MAELVPLLTHLPPPRHSAVLRSIGSARTSSTPRRLGFRNVRPLPAYHHVYPLPEHAVANLAYHFGFDYVREQRADDYIGPLLQRTARLEGIATDESTLFHVDSGRPAGHRRHAASRAGRGNVLADLDRLLYKHGWRSPISGGSEDCARRRRVRDGEEDGIAQRLERLCEAGLMVRDGRRYLALSVKLGTDKPPRAARRALRNTMAAALIQRRV